VPRRGTRAYNAATLRAHVKRLLGELHGLTLAAVALGHIRSILPEEAVLTIDNVVVGVPWRFRLDLSAVTNEELAQAVARIRPARRGRPLGHRRPVANLKLMQRIEAAVAAGEGSVRAVCERIAKRHGMSAEGLRRQYRTYRKRIDVPV
jgi:hypothetical protein